MTGGLLEENLNSLHLKEGCDYYHFNWLVPQRKKECATLMNWLLIFVSDLLVFTCTTLENSTSSCCCWEALNHSQICLSNMKLRWGNTWTSARTSQINKTWSQNMFENKAQPSRFSPEKKFVSHSRNVWKRNKLLCWKSISQPERNTVATQRNGLKPQRTEQQ